MSSIEDLTKRVEALELEVKEMKEEERWKPIEGLWDYQISSKGRIVKYNGFVPKIRLNKHSGYCQVTLAGKSYQFHRLLAQAFIPNPEEKPQVDHRDGNRQNNSLSNLRWATHVDNMRNRKRRSDNTSGSIGVTFHKGKWRARISVNNKRKHLGLYKTPEEASAAYETAAKEAFGEFYRAPQ